MSLNLGNQFIEAAATLRDNEAFRTVREALLDQVRQRMNMTLDVAPGQRDDAVGYTRALRDLYVAFESATTGQRQQHVEKPGPRAKEMVGAAR